MFIPTSVKKVLYMLESAGYEAYVVGGCVRDALMGIEPHDYDVTTSAEPQEVKSVFKDYVVIETGIKHGTVTLLMESYPVEITTFRTEGEYIDGRHPSQVFFAKSLEEDLARRDFTVNAMACDINGETHDYFGGKEDLKKGIIRAVGKAESRFEEDALRIMRALRFAAVTGFEIEPETAKAARKCKELLTKISGERLREELIKLLCGKNAKKIILEYWDVLAVFIPELAQLKGFQQKNTYHIYDVLEHTAVAVDNVRNEPILRLGAFFHDIGKPPCFTVDEAGVGHFYGHSHVSEEIARNIMNKLKFDNETKGKVLQLVKYHDVPIEEKTGSVKRALNKYSASGFFDLLEIKRADNLAQSPCCRNRLTKLDELKKIAEGIIEQEQCFSLKDLAVNGKDLINLGMRPGKELGETLNLLLEAVIEEQVPNERTKLLELVEKIIK